MGTCEDANCDNGMVYVWKSVLMLLRGTHVSLPSWDPARSLIPTRTLSRPRAPRSSTDTASKSEKFVDALGESGGSAIEMDIGRGGVVIGRQRNLNPPPVEVEGQVLDAPNDPDTPVSPDSIDAELPGEGPENLSGPDDDDPLPE